MAPGSGGLRRWRRIAVAPHTSAILLRQDALSTPSSDHSQIGNHLFNLSLPLSLDFLPSLYAELPGFHVESSSMYIRSGLISSRVGARAGMKSGNSLGRVSRIPKPFLKSKETRSAPYNTRSTCSNRVQNSIR